MAHRYIAKDGTKTRIEVAHNGLRSGLRIVSWPRQEPPAGMKRVLRYSASGEHGWIDVPAD